MHKKIQDLLRKLPKQKPRLNRKADRLAELVEEARQFLPLSRGGTGLDLKTTSPRAPRPLTKTYEFTPTVPSNPRPGGDAARFRPQEVEIMTRREEDDLQRELQDLFDQLPTEGEQELAYLNLREENERGAQNQTLENALARMGADRPRQFQTRARSRSPFTRANLLREPKKKRKVSAYSKRFGIELKKLKKLHPRTKVQNLMKKAHRRTKAAMKKK